MKDYFLLPNGELHREMDTRDVEVGTVLALAYSPTYYLAKRKIFHERTGYSIQWRDANDEEIQRIKAAILIGG